jgi:hypothetical protein
MRWEEDADDGPRYSGKTSLRVNRPKAGSTVAERLAAVLLASAPPGFTLTMFTDELRKKDAHLVHGVEVTLPDGKKMTFGESQ